MKKLLVGATLLVTTAIVVKKGAKKKSNINFTFGNKAYEPIKASDDFIEEIMTQDVILPEHLNISEDFAKAFKSTSNNH